MKRVGPLAFILFVGCDSGTTNTVAPELSAGGGDMAQAGGDMSQSSCGAPGAACLAGADKGLCKAGNCAPCTDTTDDSACVAAYGAGTICAAGSCIMGCHDSSTCAGKICDPGSNTCRGCTQDADCPLSAAFCNTTNGTCVATPPTCTNSTSCNGGAGFCCNNVCLPGAQCCGNPDCTVAGQTCDTSSNTCVNLTNCTDALPGGKFYVNPSPVPGFSGVGTKQCPFTSLSVALHAAPSPAPSTFRICTEGTFDTTNQKFWPHYIHTNIELDGTYCGDNTTHTIFTVPSAQPAVTFNQPGPASIHGYDIISAFGDHPNKTNTGIYVTNTGASAVQIADVTVHYFQRGIYVSKSTGDNNSGNVLIGDSAHSGNNDVGLRIDNGGKAIITTSDATKFTGFQSCDSYGIHVVDGTLKVNGQAATGMSNETTVRCGNNASDGIYVSDSRAKVTLDFVHSSANTFQGLSTLNTAGVTVTNSVFNNNMKHGVHIWQDSSQPSNLSLATLNFGTADTGTGAGFNLIQSNTASGINIDVNNSDALNAEANNFGNMANCAANQTHTRLLSVNDTNCDTKAYDLCGPNGGVGGGVLANTQDCGKCACNGTGACVATSCPP
jgi:Right handed beta helix region